MIHTGAGTESGRFGSTWIRAGGFHGCDVKPKSSFSRSCVGTMFGAARLILDAPLAAGAPTMLFISLLCVLTVADGY